MVGHSRDKPRSALRASLYLAAMAGLLPGSNAHATEGGGTVYPNGAETFTAGAMPPPGLYGMLFAQHYSAHRVNDDDGHDLHVPGFSVRANALVPRLIWVTNQQLLGGQLSWHAIVPVVDLKVAVAGSSQGKTGVGDITTGPGLGYHYSDKWHAVLGLDFYLPTGGYHAGDLAKVGRNYWAVEPLYVLSHIDPAGFNADLKAGYIFNRRNSDTDYRSGQEFHFDYALGWGLGNGWTAGAGGYVYQQTTSDRQAGNTVPDGKGRALALGPALKYDSGKGWYATLKWQKELQVANRAQGQALWFKAVFPL